MFKDPTLEPNRCRLFEPHVIRGSCVPIKRKRVRERFLHPLNRICGNPSLSPSLTRKDYEHISHFRLAPSGFLKGRRENITFLSNNRDNYLTMYIEHFDRLCNPVGTLDSPDFPRSVPIRLGYRNEEFPAHRNRAQYKVDFHSHRDSEFIGK